MMKFIGIAANDKFFIGCTGQTVYLYDKGGNEIAKFKDIIYAYSPILSPDNKLLVVKSTAGMLAVYSLETFSLIHKFRFSNVDGAQDDGCCFSSDGKWFLNIERQKDDLHFAISIYRTLDFSLVKQISVNKDTALNHIEFDDINNICYVLGFSRNSDGVFEYGFVAVLKDGEIKNATPITAQEYDFYNEYKYLEMMGFSESVVENTDIEGDISELKSMQYSLKKLYMHYQNRE